MIPLSHPDISDLEIDAVVSVLKNSRLSLGPRLEEFEARVAAYIGVPHAIAVSSGTAGLHLCLCALGIDERAEVIVPSFTFVAAANVIRYVRATPVFVDIDPHTLNMDPAAVERAITPRTRAIMLVHTFGLPAQLGALLAIARRHNLLVVEDACEAIGAEWHGGRVGSFGDAAVFAFYPNKQITTGEGGMIVTADPAIAREVKALRNQGRYDSDDWLQHSILGYNYRLSEIHAALGCAQMQRLESILERREHVALSYFEALNGSLTLVLPPPTLPDGRISWFVYVIRLASQYSRKHRDEVIQQMHAQGIQCGSYFAPVHNQPAYAATPPRLPLPITESVSERTIALPFFTNLSRDDVDKISRTLLEVVDHLHQPGAIA